MMLPLLHFKANQVLIDRIVHVDVFELLLNLFKNAVFKRFFLVIRLILVALVASSFLRQRCTKILRRKVAIYFLFIIS